MTTADGYILLMERIPRHGEPLHHCASIIMAWGQLAVLCSAIEGLLAIQIDMLMLVGAHKPDGCHQHPAIVAVALALPW